MQCIKTGAQIYLEEYGEYAICDTFEDKGVFLFRIVDTSNEPMRAYLHSIVLKVDNWFGRGQDLVGTLISTMVRDFGPEGKLL
jgi:hypothetical protein